MLTNPEGEGYRILNWTPIWLDSGKRLKQIIEELNNIEYDEDIWLIMAAMISAHIDLDLSLHRDGMNFLNTLTDDDE